MRLFVFLHVLSMFTAVAISYAPELYARWAARSAHVPTIRSVFRLNGRLGRFIPVAYLTGLAFGLIAVFVEGFDPFAPWLLMAYVIFVLALVLGAAVAAPWQARVLERAEASPDDAPSPELDAALRDPRAEAVFWLDWVILVAILFVMVVKPLS